MEKIVGDLIVDIKSYTVNNIEIMVQRFRSLCTTNRNMH